jgi:zinc transporter ZupT
MRMVAKSNKQMAVLFAIFLAVFSTGIVIAHQCHSMISNQVSIQHNHSDHGSAAAALSKPLNVSSDTEQLIDSGCVVLFIVVLLFGRKILDLRAPRSRLRNFIEMSRDLVSVHRPQVLQLSLSRPQLGVIRI